MYVYHQRKSNNILNHISIGKHRRAVTRVYSRQLLSDCFKVNLQNPPQASKASLSSLINPPQANQENLSAWSFLLRQIRQSIPAESILLRKIRQSSQPDQTNQAIRQTKEICEKSTEHTIFTTLLHSRKSLDVRKFANINMSN